jgi:regulator of sigma E protease
MRIDDKDVKKWSDVAAVVATSLEPTVKVVVEREHKTLEFTVETTYQRDFAVKTLGLYPPGRPIAVRIRRNSPAERAGVKPNDEFLAVEGVPINGRVQLIEFIGKRADQPTQVKVMRGGQVVTLKVVPEYDEKEKAGRMQVVLGEQIVKPGPTPVEQFEDVLAMLGSSIYAFVHHEKTGVGIRSFSGPLGIMGGWWAEFASGGMRRGLWLAVVLNINLALFNLLPVPVLDGGHILFAALEAIRRKPVNARLVHVTSTAFASLLIAFMLYITVLDIQKFLPSRSHRSQPVTNETVPAVETNHP